MQLNCLRIDKLSVSHLQLFSARVPDDDVSVVMIDDMERREREV